MCGFAWVGARGGRGPRQICSPERAEMLESLTALEHARADLAERGEGLWDVPFARGVEDAIRTAQARIDREVEILRHWLLVCDSALGVRGVRPWEDNGG